MSLANGVKHRHIAHKTCYLKISVDYPDALNSVVFPNSKAYKTTSIGKDK